MRLKQLARRVGCATAANGTVAGADVRTATVKLGFLLFSSSRYGQSCADVCECGAERDWEWEQQECVAPASVIKGQAKSGHAARMANNARAVEMATSFFKLNGTTI